MERFTISNKKFASMLASSTAALALIAMIVVL